LDGKNYSITSLGKNKISCNIPISKVSVGFHDV